MYLDCWSVFFIFYFLRYRIYILKGYISSETGHLKSSYNQADSCVLGLTYVIRLKH